MQVHVAPCPCVSACQKKAEEKKNGQHSQWQNLQQKSTSHPLNVSGKKHGLQERIPMDMHVACADVYL